MSLSFDNVGVIGGRLNNLVLDQLEARRSLLQSKDPRSEQELIYLNSNTGWVKVTSSVDLTDLPESNSRQPAEKYILFGGTSYLNLDKTSLTGGFSPGFEDYSSYKYSDKTGFTPKPGITNFVISPKNTFGTLRVATVSFTVHSIEDFSLMEQLYLRPGFTVLIEWGHSVFLDNKGKIQNIKKVFNTKEYLSSMSHEDIDRIISQNKAANFGNYDGIHGVIKNFSWSYNGMSYECTIDVVTKGELIQSLELSMAPLYDQSFKPEDIKEDNTQFTSDLHRFLTAVKKGVSKKDIVVREVEVGTVTSSFRAGEAGIRSNTPSIITKKVERKVPTDLIKYLEDNVPQIFNILKEDLEKVGKEFEFLKFQISNENWVSQWTAHIPLRVILILLNKLFLLNDQNKSPIFSFFTGNDVSLSEEQLEELGTRRYSTNFLTFSDHIGIDPRLSVLGKGNPNTATLNWSVGSLADLGEADQKDILNIFVSVDHLIKLADKHILSKSNFGSLINFLNELLSDLEDNLGGINHFDLHYVEEESKYFIVDRAVVPANNDFTGRASFIDVIGLGTDVENLNLISKLSSNITSMIAIAASDQTLPGGSADIYNVQKWNAGLKDRHFTQRNLGEKISSINPEEDEIVTTSDLIRFSLFVNNSDYGGFTYLQFSESELQSFKPIHKKLMREYVYEYTRREKTNPHGLIPFELSFTMKGLGGMKIGEAFKIPDTFLPERYRGNVAFIITGIQHTVQNNKWNTEIKTQMILSSNYEEKPATEKPSNLQISERDRLKNLSYRKPLSGELTTRSDSRGSGTYTASRVTRLHKAWDLVAPPQTPVFATVPGKIKRVNIPWTCPSGYQNGECPGGSTFAIELVGTGEYKDQLWRYGYVRPVGGITPNSVVRAGQIIGYVEDMASKYGAGMTNHLHIDIKNSVNRVFADIDLTRELKYT